MKKVLIIFAVLILILIPVFIFKVPDRLDLRIRGAAHYDEEHYEKTYVMMSSGGPNSDVLSAVTHTVRFDLAEFKNKPVVIYEDLDSDMCLMLTKVEFDGEKYTLHVCSYGELSLEKGRFLNPGMSKETTITSVKGDLHVKTLYHGQVKGRALEYVYYVYPEEGNDMDPKEIGDMTIFFTYSFSMIIYTKK